MTSWLTQAVAMARSSCPGVEFAPLNDIDATVGVFVVGGPGHEHVTLEKWVFAVTGPLEWRDEMLRKLGEAAARVSAQADAGRGNEGAESAEGE